MKYNFILALDPSGSYHEGKGTTGYCIFNPPHNFIELGTISARTYPCMEAYWDAHIKLIANFNEKKHGKHKGNFIVVIEDYFLYANKAQSQTNSRMETSKLIGLIQHYCYKHDIPYYMQAAALVKTRWSDEILEYKGYIKKDGARYSQCEHTRDAIRHAVHYANFRNKGEFYD